MKTEGGRANLLVSKEITRRFLVQRPLWDQQAKRSECIYFSKDRQLSGQH